MKQIFRVAFIIIFFMVASFEIVFSLETDSHRLVNLKVANSKIGEFDFNDFLTKQLGMINGKGESFFGKRIETWLELGGLYEDIPWNPPFDFTPPYLRSVNHYHNPITEKGFSGFLFGVFVSGDSSVKWAQKPLHTQSPGGNYSWYDARDYFYKALITRDITFREKFYAETFRALGQLMHLLQDASAPEHTRDDFHLTGYEKWVKANANINAIPAFRVDKAILNRLTSDHPIANLFDTNQYDGTDPDGTAESNMGLTEYSNANFFSDDTINSKKFRYPSINSTTIVERPYITKFGDPYTRQYYLKNCCGETNAGLGYLLSAVDCLDYWRKRDPRLSNMAKIPILDESVYKDYASLLLPRAVGYSAGLLEYFFRGRLQVTSLPIFYGNGIHIMRVKIKNITPTGETMKNGWFTLTYRYTPTGKPSDGSQDIFGQSSFCSSDLPCNELKFQDETSIDFVLPALIPRENYDSVKFTLAFKGTLGNEEGAVIGRFFTPGEIKFNEEWDNGLTGNHTWAHTDFDTSRGYPGHGSTSNTLVGDVLIKENIRYAGYKNPSVNASFVGNYIIDPKYNDILPILITPNTSLQFKLDNMSINEIPPSPTGTTAHYQGLWLNFNHGLVIQLSTDQFVYYTPQTAYLTFELGKIFVNNIYKMFQDSVITIPAGDLYLERIEFVQQLFDLEQNSPVEHRQHMEVDFIRIIEEKLQEDE